MIDEEEKRLRAYQIWESEGRPEGRDLAHWYQAADAEANAPGRGAHYMPYSPGAASPGSLVIKFYHSGDQVRGYVRKIANAGEDDSIFPGEEMAPEAAFKLAESHNGDSGKPIFADLVEGVEWDPSWGELGSGELATSTAATDDARSQDGPAAARRRRTLARKAEKGMDRAVAEIRADDAIETVAPTVQEHQRGK
ncbi:DUF2934 domain-containing protein [Rhizobium sp. RCC_161_2]|uniref:DUF2934 domain-containing protein n=1 Tax=Rhizobium sp. RCC_161_2 TaxID=3239219 RepID=UPI00352597CD